MLSYGRQHEDSKSRRYVRAVLVRPKARLVAPVARHKYHEFLQNLQITPSLAVKLDQFKGIVPRRTAREVNVAHNMGSVDGSMRRIFCSLGDLV